MEKLGKWTAYKPDPATLPEVVRPYAHRLMFFKNEQGQDWYEFQKTLPPGVYAMRDADGTILQIQRDLTKLAPVRGAELVRLSIPDTVSEETLIEGLHDTIMDDEERITRKRVPLRLNALEFMQRFTLAERKAIRRSNNEDVADFFDLLRAANTYFGLDNPLIVQGLDLLVANNLLTPARRAEILADEE
jgi:hypothetical protein